MISLQPRSSCPACGATSSKDAFSVPTRVFVSTNATIDQEALAQSGILDLPNIEIVSCTSCGLAYTNSLLSEEASRVFWQDVFITEASRSKIGNPCKRDMLIQRWAKMHSLHRHAAPNHQGPLRLLDFGCGWGDFLACAHSVGIECYGTEIDPDKASFARDLGFNIQTSLDDLPPDLTFDLVHCDQVLEHLAEPRSILSAITSRLQTNAILFFGVPSYPPDRLKTAAEAIARHEPDFVDKDLIPWDHLNFFDHITIRYLLECHGLGLINPADGEALPIQSAAASTMVWARAADEIMVMPCTSMRSVGVVAQAKKLFQKFLQRLTQKVCRIITK